MDGAGGRGMGGTVAGPSRRAWLRGAGCAAAMGAVPARAAGPAAISPVMAGLSAYMAEAGGRALPDEVAERAKHHILDTFAAMVSGSELLPAQAAFKVVRALGAAGDATVVASTLTCGPVEAALANGMLAHSDETDDSNEFSQTHPGAPIVPAAYAAGEAFDVDGARFLRAVALGYDVGPRVTMALGSLDFRNNSHRSTHAIGGCFGAAAAAGCVAGLDARQMRWLLDYASQQASGVGAWTRDTQHIEKSFVFAGMPARSGVTAALMVKAGCTGLDDIFSGSDNFFLANNPKADLGELTKELGQRYEIARTNIKKWTVGSPIQAPLDAMANILRKGPVDPDKVKSVVVRVADSEARIVNNREMPDICLQHMVAVMLLDRTASFKAAHDVARMNDPAVLRTRAKVQLVSDEELERLEPSRQAIVEITLDDGTVLRDRVTAVRGTAGNPMPREEVVEKCRDLVAPVLGAPAAQGLIDRVLGLERLASVRELRAVLQHGRAG